VVEEAQAKLRRVSEEQSGEPLLKAGWSPKQVIGI